MGIEQRRLDRFLRVATWLLAIIAMLIFVAVLALAASYRDVPDPQPSPTSMSERELLPPKHIAPRASRSRPSQVPIVSTSHRPGAARAGHLKKLNTSVGWPWDALVRCEAPDRGWRYGAPGVGIDPGYYFEGGPNFVHSTWVRYGGRAFAEHAYDASPAEQVIIAKRVLAAEGWGAWPTCSRKLGLR